MSQPAEGPVSPLPALNFGQLESFAALARWGKQAAATKALGKSQSQVSRDLAAVERALGGVLLFNRATRQMTAAGEQALDYSLKVLEGWGGLHSVVKEGTQGAGRVVLAAEPDVLMAALLPVLTSLKQRFPQARVRTLVCSRHEAAEAVRNGGANVGVFASAGPERGLHQLPLLQAETLLALPASSPLARAQRISAGILREEILVLPPVGSALRDHAADMLCKGHELRQEVCEAGPGREAVLAAVAAGLGVGLVVVFPQAGDPLLRQPLPGVVLRHSSGLKHIQYCIAVRRGLPAGGPTSMLIRHLLRAFRILNPKGTDEPQN